jgi:hypothetical protein
VFGSGDYSLEGVTLGCRMGCFILIKKQITVIRKMNLLSLINPSLAHVYCSTTLSNHGLIRLKKIRLAKPSQSVHLVS